MDKKRIHEMLEKMTEWSLCEMQSKGKEGVDTKEMGEVIDMVKDLAEAEKAVWEKCYYEKIVEAMKDEEEEMKIMGLSRAGYDRWRTSSGRFAPKGTGHETSMAVATGRAGYDPKFPNPYYDDPNLWPMQPWATAMGYSGGDRNSQRSADGRSSGGSDVAADGQSRMGYTPTEKDMRNADKHSRYEEAKRYYHESGSEQDRHAMTERGKEYVAETIQTMHDMLMEADPELQKKIKDDIFWLYRELGGK